MPATAVFRPSTVAPVFTALGDETRLHIVNRLCREGPLSIARLTSGTRISRQAVTKHLRVLADAGLAVDTRQGRERLWRVETQRLDDASRYLATISAQWDAAIERLHSHVENNPG